MEAMSYDLMGYEGVWSVFGRRENRYVSRLSTERSRVAEISCPYARAEGNVGHIPQAELENDTTYGC